MRFGATPLAAAEGAILAHLLRVGDRAWKKGRRLSSLDVQALADAGVSEVVCATLEPGDVHEDEAAARIARAIAGPGVREGAASTGRVNLHATARGVVLLDPEAVGVLNAIDERVTLATVAPFARAERDEIVATVKIIPFAVPEAVVLEAERRATSVGVGVRAFGERRPAMIATVLPGTRTSVVDRAVANMRTRLEGLGARLVEDRRCEHAPGAVERELRSALEAGASPILVLGASAIVDRGDVVPEAVRAAGGTVERLGMPVDPGNLLMLGHCGAVPIVGVPGCARSLKRSGFDAVLERLFAGLDIGPEAIGRLGVGGLLSDIASRPAPRRPVGVAPRVAAIVLAAGQATRMRGVNKLVAEIDGQAILARLVEELGRADVGTIVVVTGHEAERVRAVLDERAVLLVHNERHAEGMSTSLRVGLRALPDEVTGVLVCLGDMPRVSATDVAAIVAAFSPEDGREIVVPVHAGHRGHPVLFAARFFAEIEALTGDVGARAVLERHRGVVHEVVVDDDAVLVDVDTPEQLAGISAREERPWPRA